jgi:uncharacterized protein
MEIIAIIATVCIGLSLGLIGAGGSILTVPVLVYLFHVPVLLATSYSLFVVGTTSLLGACYQFRQRNINGRVALLFSLVSLSVVSCIRNWVLPNLPSKLFFINSVPVTTSLMSMVLFAFLMIVAATAMIRQRLSADTAATTHRSVLRLVLSSLLVGLVTGLLGAGGGFILIPSLVLLLHLPVKTAIGTSLFIISINSLAGFALDLHHVDIAWTFLVHTTLLAAFGMLLGLVIGRKVSAQSLKRSFGWFVMLIGLTTLAKELIPFAAKLRSHETVTAFSKSN